MRVSPVPRTVFPETQVNLAGFAFLASASGFAP